MSDQRQELLDILLNASTSAQQVELLLRQLAQLQSAYPERVSSIDDRLGEALHQRTQLNQCIERIEGRSQELRTFDANRAAISGEHDVDQTSSDVPAEVARLHAATLREIDIYSSGIAAAESSGLFETKLVFEAILLQKTAMSTWLSEWMMNETAPRALHRV